MSGDYGLTRALVFILLALLEPVMRLATVFAPGTTIVASLALEPLREWSRPPCLPEPWTDLRLCYLAECRGGPG